MECAICFEPYDLEAHRPKSLPCGHSFCLQCLSDPNFVKQCPQDRKVFEGDPAELPDNFSLTSIIAHGGVPQRSSFWCRDCEKDFSDDCADAGHRSCSQRQLRAERIASHVQTLERGAAAAAVLEQHFKHVSQDAQRQVAVSCSHQCHLQEALANLREAAEAKTGLKQALDAAELRGPQAARLEESASLVGLRGRCTVAVQAEDGAEWRASVALDDGKRALLLRHALLWLSWAGDLTKVNDDPVQHAVEGATGRTLDLSEMHPGPDELSAVEMAEFLQRGSLKQVHSLRGVDCSQAPKFCELLLQAVGPHLESLVAANPRAEHLIALRAMPSLRELSLTNKMKGPIPALVELPYALEVLCIRQASLEHMRMLQRLPLLRRLDVSCAELWPSAPELPLQLEELTLERCSRHHLLSVERMPRLRRLYLDGLSAIRDLDLAPPPQHHCGLAWLRLASTNLPPQVSLIRAHAATLEEVQLFTSSLEEVAGRPSACFFPGLADELRQCDFRALRRLLLLRRLDGWKERAHSVESCRRQVHELQDALLRRDAAGKVEVVAVECNICDENVQP